MVAGTYVSTKTLSGWWRPDGISHLTLLPADGAYMKTATEYVPRIWSTPIGEVAPDPQLALKIADFVAICAQRKGVLPYAPRLNRCSSKSSVVLVSNQSPRLISALRHEPISAKITPWRRLLRVGVPRILRAPCSAVSLAAVYVIVVAVNVLLSRCL